MTFRKLIRAVAIRVGLVSAALAVAFLLLELGFRLFYPQVMLTPRYDFLPDIGIINFPGVTMRHRKPGVFDFAYTINAERYRGALVPFDGGTTRIVVLGDSNSFGFGVQDDETYSFRLNRLLAGHYEAVNLSNGGWGLTQEIARFVTFGVKYHPKIVILQFCGNDPADNLRTPLVAWRDDTRSFEVTPLAPERVNRFRRLLRLSKPLYTVLTGHSQSYNFLRDRLYRLTAGSDRVQILLPEDEAAAPRPATPRATGAAVAEAERRYNELLEHFARYLQDSGAQLILIDVNGQLEWFPGIEAGVAALQQAGVLTYLDTRKWFPQPPAPSPDGHHWGRAAHARIAEGLAQFILKR